MHSSTGQQQKGCTESLGFSGPQPLYRAGAIRTLCTAQHTAQSHLKGACVCEHAHLTPFGCLVLSSSNINIEPRISTVKVLQQAVIYRPASSNYKEGNTSLGVLVQRGLLSFCTAHSSEVLLTVRVTGSTGSAASLPSSLAYASYLCFHVHNTMFTSLACTLQMWLQEHYTLILV